MKETIKKGYDYRSFLPQYRTIYSELLDALPYDTELDNLFSLFKKEHEACARSDRRHLDTFKPKTSELFDANSTCEEIAVVEGVSRTAVTKSIKNSLNKIRKLGLPLCG